MKFTATILAVFGVVGVLAHQTDSLNNDNNLHSNENATEDWAGAVQVGAGYRSVSATLVVPDTVGFPPRGNKSVQHAVSAWVGIDGAAACPGVSVQVGVDMYRTGNVSEYEAWMAWLPTFKAHYFPTFPIIGGDLVDLAVTVTSLSNATVSFANHRTGITQMARLPPDHVEAPTLCGFSAEWVVEARRYESCCCCGNATDTGDGTKTHVPMASFDEIQFVDPRFKTNLGVDGGIHGGTVVNLMELNENGNETEMVACKTDGKWNMKCTYYPIE